MPAIIGETIGTMLLVFIYLTQTEEKTKLSKDGALTMFILAASYLGSILMVGSVNLSGYGVCNPAIGMMTAIVMSF